MKYIIFFLILLNSFSLAYASTLRIAVEDKEDFPHVMGNGSKVCEDPGVAIEMMRLLAEDLGYELEFVRQPWKRCIHNLLRDGEVDILLPASFKENRLENGVYPYKNGAVDSSKRYAQIRYSFYKRKDSNTSWDGQKLSSLTCSVGAPLGYSIVDDLKKMDLNVQESTLESALRKLVLGRVGLVAALELAADRIIAENEDLSQNIEKIEVPLKTKNYYVMLSHKFVASNPDLAEKIWDKIAELRESDYDVLLLKYFVR